MDHSDIGALLAACPDQRARLIVVLMAQCGLRAGDLARVRVDDIDFARRRMDVRAKGGGGDVTHTVPVPAEAWGMIDSWLRGRRRGPLIANERRNTLTAVTGAHLSRLVRGWMREAGVKHAPWDGVSAHALRHTCAQDMLDGGASVDEVRAVLGHRTCATTELFYLRCEPRGLAAAIEGRHYLPAA